MQKTNVTIIPRFPRSGRVSAGGPAGAGAMRRSRALPVEQESLQSTDQGPSRHLRASCFGRGKRCVGATTTTQYRIHDAHAV